MKKFFAALLAMIMVLSLVPATIFAAEAVCPGEDETHNADNCVATAVETKEPVCGEWGYTIYKCDTCGAQYADNFVKGDDSHDYGEWTVIEEPTCDEVGEKVRECSVCGDEDYEDIAALGHKYETTDGIGCAAKQVCSVCGDEVEAGAHSWGSSPSAILEEPYFDAEGVAHDGLAEYTCTVCGDVKQVIIICEHEHEFELVIEAEEADCLNDGTIDVYQCKICKKYFKLVKNENAATGADGDVAPDCYIEITLGESEEEGGNVIPATGHDFTGEGVRGTNSCIEVKTCLNGCGATKATEGDEINHIDRKLILKAEATCTKYGFELWGCTNCGMTDIENLTAPLGHKETTVTVPGTCTYPGYTFTYCANENCPTYKLEGYFTASDTDKPEDYYRFTDEDALAHGLTYNVYVENEDGEKVKVHLISIADTDTVADYHKLVADVDDLDGDEDVKELIPANTEYVLVQAPTCYTSGVGVWHCVLCGFHKEQVAQAGHNFELDEEQSVPATCEEPGVNVYVCSGCGLTKTEETEIADHEWYLYQEGYDCDYNFMEDEDGTWYVAYKIYKCANCDAENTVITPSEDHVIESYFTTLEEALKVHCYYDIYYEIDSEDGELYLYTDYAALEPGDEGYVYNAPTCTEVGYQSYICYNCGHNFLVEIPKSNHIEGEYHEEVPYSCYEDGKKAYYDCDACDAMFIYNEKQEQVVVTESDLVIPAKHLGDYETINKFRSSCVEPDWDEFAEAIKELPLDATQLEQLAFYLSYGYGLKQDVTVCYACGSLFNDEECTDPYREHIRWILEYPGHILVDVDGKEATCQYSGLVAGEYCVKPDCGYHTDSLANFEITFNKDETVKKVTYDQEVIPAFNHVYNPSIHGLEGSAIFELDHNDPLHGCKRADCHNDCGMEIYWHHICDICEKEWIDGYKSAAEGHTNEAGELILDICDPDEDADRHCVICDQDIAAKEHDIVEVVVEATCVADGYTLYYCKNCDYRKVIESDIDLMHPDKHPDESIVEDLESGVAYCELCGKILGKAVALIPTTDVEVVSDGATFTVQVVINATELEVWGLKFDLLYEAEVLELVDAKIASENFTYAGQINDFIYDEWLGVISVALNAEDDVVVDGEQLVLEATFKVNNPYEYETAHFATYAENDWDDPNALNKDGEPIWAIGFELEIELDLFLDVDDDGIAATMLDALAMYELILADEYYAPADTDGDGVITMVDLINLYDVIVGKTTANELLGREPVEAPEEVPAD